MSMKSKILFIACNWKEKISGIESYILEKYMLSLEKTTNCSNILIVDKFNCQSKDIDIAIDLMYQGKLSNYIEMDLKFNNGFKPRKSFLTIFK